MLDPYVRPLIDGPLNSIGKRMAAYGISANFMTLLGFAMGLVSIFMISVKSYHMAVLFLCLNRLFDGLDGAIARHSQLSDFGGFLDIVCDFIIYAGIVFAFGIANPNHFFYAAFLIFSFIGPMSSFLAYATIAAKRKINCVRRGKKSFYYLGGICEGTETAALLILLCLFPRHFNSFCFVFGILCWLTTAGRVYRASVDFGSKPILEDSFETSCKGPAIKIEGQDQ